MSYVKFDKLFEQIIKKDKLVVEYLGVEYELYTNDMPGYPVIKVCVPSLGECKFVRKFSDGEYYSLAQLLFSISYRIENESVDKLNKEAKEQKVFDKFMSNVKEVN